MQGLGARLFAVLFALTLAGGAWGREVRLCVDPEPPPWSYWERDAQGRRTDRLVGSTVDLMRHVFGQLDIEVRFVTAPWARCLLWAARGEADFAVGGFRDEQRAKVFEFSAGYRTSMPHIFSRRDHPVRVQKREQLKPLRGCGLTGASYAHFGLRPGELDQGVGDYQRLIQKLMLGRCDYFPEELEAVESLKLSGQISPAEAERLHEAPATWAVGPTLHLLAARGGSAAALLPQINPVLLRAARDGTAAEFWRRHGGRSPYLP